MGYFIPIAITIIIIILFSKKIYVHFFFKVSKCRKKVKDFNETILVRISSAYVIAQIKGC